MISVHVLANIIQKASDDFDNLHTDDVSFAHFVARYVASAINLQAKRRGKKPIVTPK